MGSRMDKYKNEDSIPTRSDKNKELYKQIYNAYDEFENLIVPSNAREITMSDLKKEITSRSEYREQKELQNLKKEEKEEKKINSNEKKETYNSDDEVYDINELLDKAVGDNKDQEKEKTSISNGDYLKKLKLDNRKTNIEQVKEMYEEIKEDESLEEDEALLKTANLSLEILSDLKSDNDATMVSAPIKNDELPEDNTSSFYSTNYKFTKKDFESKDDDDDDEEEDEDDDENDEESGNGKFFLKVLLLIFGIFIIAGVLFFIIKYFNKV